MIRMLTMGGEELQLAGDSLSLEINNPYFEEESIPGTTSLPFGFSWTRDNLRGLGFPHRSKASGGPAPLPVQLFIDGPLWQLGALKYIDCDEAKKQLSYNFAADAGALREQIKGVLISDLDLGEVPFLRTNTGPDYALLPVRNPEFYGDKNKDFKGILNYYGPAGYPIGSSVQHAFAPQPYLVSVLRKVMQHFGWTVVGEFLDEPEIQTLAIYSDRAHEDSDGLVPATVILARHVPTITVAALLLALQGLFTLGYQFDTQRRVLRIRRLGRELARTDYQERSGQLLRSVPNRTNGWVLVQSPDDNDDLDDVLDTSWQKLRLGAGGEEITVEAGTLHMVVEEDPLVAGREWLVPAISAKGASEAYGLGSESKTGLRLLFNRGMQQDSRAGQYPLGSSGNVSYGGTQAGQLTLLWDGAEGLHEQFGKAWYAFRSRAMETEYEMPFNLADLRSLDPGRLEMVDAHLRLWKQISLTIDVQRKLGRATILYHEVR
ncbi:hypothetical protein [Hymenobacter psychrotolerans]|uniref:Uncharacterized protein n=1 Tax=Hymenobacter psychrotolerans DSM 18569 TaxID=1121959 RepID=A0A1M6Z651_9BACT|nr:hypothetical protein [Hymenobacter psychrotolerans]SHL25872.1 hypothetical protein SAMN02746009_02433 [Hymenobacter psychrotolerans DSM 18569]